MKAITLKAEERKNLGKNAVKKLRKQGYTPGVIYGHHYKEKGIQAKTKELNRVLMQQGFKGMVNLEIDGRVIPAIIKEVQSDKMNKNVIHVDFQHVSLDEKVKISVPILLRGREKVENSDRIIQQQLSALEIQCYPQDIPEEIEANAEILLEEETLKVGDLEILKDEKIEVLHEPEEIIAILTYAAKYDASAEEEAEANDEAETGAE
ncbi:MAG TPA: 50S ribosomal protein L25 [Clostridiales bacterium]|nr:50S ribosomal protein L25 [Clostridiales bacterium]